MSSETIQPRHRPLVSTLEWREATREAVPRRRATAFHEALKERTREREAIRILRSTCLSLRGGMAVGGSPIPIWAGVGARARAILESCEPNSPAFELYTSLAAVTPSHLPILAPDLEEEE
jgi:hypothetical protein